MEAEYAGDWVAWKYHGNGVARYADGSRYEGEFREGLRHGRGSFSWADGTYEVN